MWMYSCVSWQIHSVQLCISWQIHSGDIHCVYLGKYTVGIYTVYILANTQWGYTYTVYILGCVSRVSTAPRALTDAQPKMCGRSQAFPLKMMTMIISVIIIVRWWNHRQRIHKNLPACRIKKHLFAKCSQNVETHSFPTMCTTGGSKWIKAKIFSKAAKK